MEKLKTNEKYTTPLNKLSTKKILRLIHPPEPLNLPKLCEQKQKCTLLEKTLKNQVIPIDLEVVILNNIIRGEKCCKCKLPALYQRKYQGDFDLLCWKHAYLSNLIQ